MSRNEEKELKHVSLGPPRWGVVLFLFAIWVLLSGKLDLFHLWIGVFGVAAVSWLDRRLGLLEEDEPRRKLHLHYDRGIVYIGWLFWQIVVSAIHVAQVILDLNRCKPSLVRFRSAQPHAIARVGLGNSITLTPGSLTLDIDGDQFVVHALTADVRDSLLEGTMQRKVAHVFGTELEEPVTEGEIVEGRVEI